MPKINITAEELQPGDKLGDREILGVSNVYFERYDTYYYNQRGEITSYTFPASDNLQVWREEVDNPTLRYSPDPKYSGKLLAESEAKCEQPPTPTENMLVLPDGTSASPEDILNHWREMSSFVYFLLNATYDERGWNEHRHTLHVAARKALGLAIHADDTEIGKQIP